MQCKPLYSKDLHLCRGVTLRPWTITCKDTVGNAVDLTGATVAAKIRRDDGTIIHDIAPSISDAVNGEITMGITDEQTAALQPGVYSWDLLITTAEGDTLPPIVGGACHVDRTATAY